MNDDHQIQTRFGTRSISPTDVRAWETKRARKTLRKYGVTVPAGDLDVLRTTLTDAKLALGRPAIERRLAREIGLSDRVTHLLARGSGTRRRISRVELFAPGAKADQLVRWYAEKTEADDEAVFLEACPDHHLFRPDPRGLEVWETTGGSPLASRFFIDLDDAEGLVTTADPSYPVQMVGAARLADGTLIGGVRHQFRDEDGGARVILTVELPWLIGPYSPAAHRWHLACEFSAWIQAAATGNR